MDELLELMEESPPSEERPGELVLMMEEPLSPTVEHRTLTTAVTPSNSTIRGNQNSSRSRNSSSSRSTISKPISAGVDDKLGIRMINRLVGSVDLLDLISINPYYSPASLSAMSLSGLSQILIDPPRTIDQATVCGKTNVATVGIVFNNTGTRISQKGGAFCVLTIGSFVSGPCASVMLFGDVYSKFCRTCVPGKVVALVNPKLMPTKPGGRTSVSFTVYDLCQFMLVATSRDYGVCKATKRVRDSDGKWTPTGKCKNYVDKRKCDMCDIHRKQQQKKIKGESAVQKLRNESIFSRIPQRVPSNFVSGNKTKSDNSLLNSTASKNGNEVSRGSIGLGRSVPMSMKKDTISQKHNRLLKNASSSTTNSMQKRQKMKYNVKPVLKRKTGIVGTSSLVKKEEDWFQKGSAPVANSRASSFVKAVNKKRRKVNTDGCGFNGSVQVPKPSLLFQSKSQMVISNVTTSRSSSLSSKRNAEVREKVLANQATLARSLLSRNSNSSNPNPYTSKIKKINTTGSVKNTKGASFYDSLGDVNLEKIKNSKSRFASDLEAEEYAKSRQKVLKLENLEASKEAKAKKMNKENMNNGFVTVYYCKNCGTNTSFAPKSCIRSKHQVKQTRSLAASQSKTEKRTSLHQKSAEDGGLRLGAGNDWSRNLKDFHS